MFSKNTIIRKTIEVGGYTLMSRFLGIVREILMVQFLGPTALSDAFLTAFKIPNSLRKVFAEGALSAAFVPSLVQKMKDGAARTAGLMSIAFLVFETIVLVLCILVMVNAGAVISFIAPGFSPDIVATAIPFLRILMPFILFLSSSALIAGALHSIGHFFVPAIAPVVLNVIFISGIIICRFFGLSPIYLCWFILLGGAMQLLIHLIMFFYKGFYFGAITKSDWQQFGHVALKFLFCLPSVSIMELNLFIDTSFASWLSEGSISLLYYANRFANIPIGIFAVAFSTILLPYFSRVSITDREKLPFYLFEAVKTVFWVIVPVALLMSFFSKEIFYTTFFSKKFTLEHVHIAASVLTAFMIGLFSFSVNKILVNIYYALHLTWIPALVSVGATLFNILFNWLFLYTLKAPGLALATSFSAIIQTGLLLIILHWYCNISFSINKFVKFIMVYVVQLASVSALFLLLYQIASSAIVTYTGSEWSSVLFQTMVFWFWVGPLVGLCFIILWRLRNSMGNKLYFLS